MKFSKTMDFQSAESRYGRAEAGRVFAELETDLKRFVSTVSKERGKKKNDWEWMEVQGETKNQTGFNEATHPEKKGTKHPTTKMVFLNEHVSSKGSDDRKTHVGANGTIGAGGSINVTSSASSASRTSLKVPTNDASGVKDSQSHSTSLKECVSGHKRKRDCLEDMLGWIYAVASDPTSPAIGTIPERSKWKSFGNGSDQPWKQVLSVREAMFLKTPEGTSPEHYNFQKKQKMHPSMYDDVPVNPERSRSRSRRTFLASSTVANLSSVLLPKRIPVGSFFQAELPEWTGTVSESDSKWLGTRTWPRERIDMSQEAKVTTNDPCVCEFPGSPQCTKYHIGWERMKIRDELGSVYFQWKLNEMGEEVAVSWSKMEEEKFKEVVKANPFSLGKCFWDELVNVFPGKSREQLVSYYFNVFILRRRAHQNRHDPRNIDSDDDESELA